MMSAPAPRPRAPSPPGIERKLNVIQGEHQVSNDPDIVLTTLLGSCVAACLHDPVTKVGGLNHFLLPDSDGGAHGGASRYGAYAMELLINDMLKAGARRERIRVWLFGGARLFDRLSDIGARNADFAEAFVKREELTFVGGSLRGTHPRRVQFWPVSGRVRQMNVVGVDPAAVTQRIPVQPAPESDVELF